MWGKWPLSGSTSTRAPGNDAVESPSGWAPITKMAAVELRGILPRGAEARIWRDALSALVAGFGLDRALRSN